MSDVPVITLDGPSGAGKGTLASLLAEHFDFHILDSGAIYRLLALAALKENLDLDNENSMAALASRLEIEFRVIKGESVRTFLAGEDVSHQLRQEKSGLAASRVAVHPGVRSALLQKQRDFRKAPGLVADGRDMGTVVFADSPYKFYLTASAEIRAERRYKQLSELGVSATISALLQEIRDRDERDSSRKMSPLVPAKDAYVLDTSDLDASEVFRQVLEKLEEKGLY